MRIRSIYNGEVRDEQIGQEITVYGWVNSRRDHGGLIFVDLRDRTGLLQLVFDPSINKESFDVAENLRSEFVIGVTGVVRNRGEGLENPKLATGTVELAVHDITLFNRSKTPPIYIDDHAKIGDEVRMKYRYLDLRRPSKMNNLLLRSKATHSIRRFLDQEGFIDIETPYLAKSTPEGARDYLVPSRVHEGEFYALPQSPQLFKELLMTSGFDRYYQVVRCFRDEDLRGDRQPEFTQVDLETSFLPAEEIQRITEELLKQVLLDTLGIEIETPFPRMPYDEAISRFGSDKPDTRFGLELIDVSDVVAKSDLQVFKKAEQVKAINLKGLASEYSRKDADNLANFVARYGAKGLAWLKVDGEDLKGPIAKFLVEEKEELNERLDAKDGDIIFLCADKKSVVADSLGALRNHFGKKHQLIDQSKFDFLWIVDWPMFEYSEEEKRYKAMHHPFTLPQADTIQYLQSDLSKVRAEAYDIVLNGYELGGGSLRIHEKELQTQVLKAIGLPLEKAQEQFGFLLDAMDYGFPPVGGLALGLDRFIMLLAGEENIREVIAFSKNNQAIDVLSNAPSEVSQVQLNELGLKIK